MTNPTVRFYAGAAEAAGTEETTVELPSGSTTARLVAELGAGDSHLTDVLQVCTLLLDGRPTTADDVLPDGEVSVDVLPPFAGG